MLRVGLTGGMGSGKSTVAKRLDQLGAKIIDADIIAREIVEPGQPALEELADTFGADILREDGTLDRAELASRAFATEEATKKLNAITHPRIAALTKQRYEGAGSYAVVVYDMPLLIENGLAEDQHLVLVVSAPEALRVDRLVESRGVSREDAQRRIATQVDDQTRLRAADVVLDNSGTQEQLIEQVDQAWHQRIRPMLLEHAVGGEYGLATVPQQVQPVGRVEREIKRVEKQLGVAVVGSVLSDDELILMIEGEPTIADAPWVRAGANWTNLDPGNPVTLTPSTPSLA